MRGGVRVAAGYVGPVRIPARAAVGAHPVLPLVDGVVVWVGPGQRRFAEAGSGAEPVGATGVVTTASFTPTSAKMASLMRGSNQFRRPLLIVASEPAKDVDMPDMVSVSIISFWKDSGGPGSEVRKLNTGVVLEALVGWFHTSSTV